MSFLKLRAPQLFDGVQMLDDQYVLIVSLDGTIESIVEVDHAGEGILDIPGIISPGFINCHCHLELSHMKGHIPAGSGLIDFVSKVVSQRHFPEQEILDAIRMAEDEMLANGIVAVGDICNNTLTVSQKSQGRIWYHNFIEASGFDPKLAEQRFQRSLDFFREYAKLYTIPVASNSIVPHAPYSVSNELWERIVHFPGNQLITIHNQETPDEDRWFRAGDGMMGSLYRNMQIDASFFQPSGRSSLQTWLPRLLPNQSIVSVHNVYTQEEDIFFSKEHRGSFYWCLCPHANLYISNELPGVELMVKHDCNIVVGTDSLASNHQLSILHEIKCLADHFPSLRVDQLLGWATMNGARALQMESMLGSFEKGKKPGVLAISAGLESVHRII